MPQIREWIPNLDYKSKIEGFLAHLSLKLVNSNSIPGGVRLSSKLNIHYVCVSSIGPNNIGIDYMKMDTTDKTIRQIHAVMSGRPEEYYSNIPPEETTQIKNLIRGIEKRDFTENLEVDYHLKQIIMPDKNGKDFAITPLHSAGLMELLNRKEKELLQNDKIEKLKRIRIPVGGANPQNIGALARNLGRPLFYKPPTENFEIKETFRYYFNGIRPLLFKKQIDSFLKILDGLRGDTYSLKDREYIRLSLTEIVNNLFTRCDRAISLLINNRSELSETDLIDSNLFNNLVQRGLLLKDHRDKTWRTELSNQIVKNIQSRIRIIDGQIINSGITEQEKRTFQSIIEEEIL